MTRQNTLLDIIARRSPPELRAVVEYFFFRGAPEEALQGTYCAGCSFCCWSMAVHHVPLVSIKGHPLGKVALKHGGTDCAFDTGRRCKLHGSIKMPHECAGYMCPYTTTQSGMPLFWLMGYKIVLFPWRVHQPEIFREVLQRIDFSGIVPAIPIFIPVEQAKQLIESTRACFAQDISVVMLMCADLSRGDFAERQWNEVIRSFTPLTHFTSMNRLQAEITKREFSRPEVQGIVQGLIAKGIRPGEAGDPFGFEQHYQIILTPEEQRQIMAERRAA